MTRTGVSIVQNIQLKGVKWYMEYYNQKVHHSTKEKPVERYFAKAQKAA